MEIVSKIVDEQLEKLVDMIADAVVAKIETGEWGPVVNNDDPPDEEDPPEQEGGKWPLSRNLKPHQFWTDGKIVVLSPLLNQMAWSDDDGWLVGKIANGNQGYPCNWILEEERATGAIRHALITVDSAMGIYEFPNTARIGPRYALKCRYKPGYHSRLARFVAKQGFNDVSKSKFHRDSDWRQPGPKPEGW